MLTKFTAEVGDLRKHSTNLAELSDALDQTVFNVQGAAIGDEAYGQLLSGFASDIRRISQPGIDVLVQAAEIMNGTSDDMHKSALGLGGVEERAESGFKAPK